MHMHTHTHARTHARTHAHTHTSFTSMRVVPPQRTIEKWVLGPAFLDLHTPTVRKSQFISIGSTPHTTISYKPHAITTLHLPLSQALPHYNTISCTLTSPTPSQHYDILHCNISLQKISSLLLAIPSVSCSSSGTPPTLHHHLPL